MAPSPHPHPAADLDPERRQQRRRRHPVRARRCRHVHRHRPQQRAQAAARPRRRERLLRAVGAARHARLAPHRSEGELSDANGLALYTYVDDKWQRLGDALLVAGGEAARGDVSALPGNVAVLRRNQSTLQVAGAIPAGATLHERAGPALTTLHPLVFIPAESGDLAGLPPAVPPASYKVVPVVVAPAPDVVDNILRSTELRDHAQATLTPSASNPWHQRRHRSVNRRPRAVHEFVQRSRKCVYRRPHLTLTLPMPLVEAGAVDTGVRLGAWASRRHIEIATD
jgi:hypothetical protein